MKRFECSAILFDLDGVLVDSTAFVEQQWRRWASARGLPAEPFLRVCHGRRALETIRLAAPHLDAEAEVEAFVPAEEPDGRRARAVGRRRRACSTRLPAGSWAVATSGVRTVADDRLGARGCPCPAVLVCAEDVARGKPSPMSTCSPPRGLGVLAGRLPRGRGRAGRIQAARAAGMAVVGAHHHAPGSRSSAPMPAPSSLAGVHLGRIDQRRRTGTTRLEILVVEP